MYLFAKPVRVFASPDLSGEFNSLLPLLGALWIELLS